jgi:N-methylhydantoinase A
MAFHAVHRERYGYAQEQNQVEIVSARLRSFGLVEQLDEEKSRMTSRRQPATPSDQVTAYLSGKRATMGVYRRDDLQAGMKLRTPCIVTEYSATTVIPADAEASLDQFRNLIIRLR